MHRYKCSCKYRYRYRYRYRYGYAYTTPHPDSSRASHTEHGQETRILLYVPATYTTCHCSILPGLYQCHLVTQNLLGFPSFPHQPSADHTSHPHMVIQIILLDFFFWKCVSLSAAVTPISFTWKSQECATCQGFLIHYCARPDNF